VGQLLRLRCLRAGQRRVERGSTITIVGYVIAGVLTVATIVVARLSLRSRF